MLPLGTVTFQIRVAAVLPVWLLANVAWEKADAGSSTGVPATYKEGLQGLLGLWLQSSTAPAVGSI